MVSANVSSTSYGYDAAGRLSALSHDLAGTSADQALTFAYNPASQIVTRTSSNDAYASNTAYNVSRSYGVNGLNQYTAAGPASFTYDADGNLTSDGTNSYVYDAENRLVSRSGGVTLSYDPMGRLWQVASPSGATLFTYDGDDLIEEYSSANWRLRAYTHGPGEDEPIEWQERDGGGWARRFFHADHQGSIIAVADTIGNSLAINGYDAWGIPNAANQGRFGYTGQAWLPELGMWYYKARIYSPTLGRFLQTDPIGYKDQVNLYAYVGNDPLDGTDPSGLECTGSNVTDRAGECIGGGTVNGSNAGGCEGNCSGRQPIMLGTSPFRHSGTFRTREPFDDESQSFRETDRGSIFEMAGRRNSVGKRGEAGKNPNPGKHPPKGAVGMPGYVRYPDRNGQYGKPQLPKPGDERFGWKEPNPKPDSSTRAGAAVAGTVILGGLCLLAEPCGGAVASVLAFLGLTTAAAQ